MMRSLLSVHINARMHSYIHAPCARCIETPWKYQLKYKLCVFILYLHSQTLHSVRLGVFILCLYVHK